MQAKLGYAVEGTVKERRAAVENRTHPVQSGSRQRNACWRSRKHRRCPPAAGTALPFPLKENDGLLVHKTRRMQR